MVTIITAISVAPSLIRLLPYKFSACKIQMSYIKTAKIEPATNAPFTVKDSIFSVV